MRRRETQALAKNCVPSRAQLPLREVYYRVAFGKPLANCFQPIYSLDCIDASVLPPRSVPQTRLAACLGFLKHDERHAVRLAHVRGEHNGPACERENLAGAASRSPTQDQESCELKPFPRERHRHTSLERGLWKWHAI